MITYYCQCGEKVVTNQARNRGWLIIRVHVAEVPNVPKSLNI